MVQRDQEQETFLREMCCGFRVAHSERGSQVV